MSDYTSYPAEGISHLTVDAASRDAILQGEPGLTTIQVTYVGRGHEAPPQFVAEAGATRFTGAVLQLLIPDAIALTVREARGDLKVQGLGGTVNLPAVRGDLRLEKLAGSVLLGAAQGDIRAENVNELRITDHCSGDLRFVDGGVLAVEDVAGDVRVTGAQALQARRVAGDLWADRVAGEVTIEHADGDVRLADAGGAVTVGSLAGDLRTSGLAGGLAASGVAGDVGLHGPFAAGQSYSVHAAGDVHVHLEPEADVRLVVQAAGRIRSDVSLTPAANGKPSFSASLGQGASRISITASGDVRVKHAGAERGAAEESRRASRGYSSLGDLGERIRQQVTASLAAAGINLETGEINLGPGDHLRGSRGTRGARPPEPPRPPGRPAGPSADEQLAILRMVEEGKITPDEADTLLKALGA